MVCNSVGLEKIVAVAWSVVALVGDGTVCVQLMGIALNIDDCSSRHT